MSVTEQPKTLEDFTRQLEEMRHTLPKKLLQCADFIFENQDRVALGTVAELSAAAEVSPSAMMRFAQAMGFEGYTDMQRLFRAQMQGALPDYSTRLKHLQSAGAGSPSAVLAEFLDAGRNSLEKLTSSVDPRVLDQAVTRLTEANVIHIKGLRRAFPVATYLAYAFEKMSIPAMLHQGAGQLEFFQSLRENDAVIAVTFSPYSTETLNFIREANKRGLPIVIITDKISSNHMGEGMYPILVKEVDFGAFRALSATLTVAISLAVSVGAARDQAE